MTIRISTNLIFENIRLTLRSSISNLLHVQEIMASQMKVNHLSDDPVAAGQILNTSAMISQQEQFIQNLGNGSTLSDMYDGAFENSVTLLSRAKELLLGAANSATSTVATREASRIEIVSLADQLTAIANLQYGNRFLFAGYIDDAAPFFALTANVVAGPVAGGATVTQRDVGDPSLVTGDAYQLQFTSPATFDILNTTTGAPVSTGNAYVSGASILFDGIALRLTDTTGSPAAGDTFTITTTPAGAYAGDSGLIRLEMEQDVYHQVNVTGDRAFQGAGIAGGVNLFDILERANVALRNNDQAEIQTLLSEFDRGLSQTSGQQSRVGSRYNLFKTTMDRLLDVKLNLQSFLSQVRDVDLAEAVIELNRRENAFQAVLGASATIIQPNLLDFLR